MLFNLNLKKSEITTSGIYLYNVRTNKLLICHSMFDRWINWSIPNGNKKSNEDTYACANRVVKEKTGIDLQKFTVLNMFSLTPANCKFQNKIMGKSSRRCHYSFAQDMLFPGMDELKNKAIWTYCNIKIKIILSPKCFVSLITID